MDRRQHYKLKTDEAPPVIDVGIATDTHRRFASVPSANEDAGLACVLPASPDPLAILCVCDGVGGNLGGDRASQTAVRRLLGAIAAPWGRAEDLASRLNSEWVDATHEAVVAQAVPGSHERPATTLAIAISEGRRVLTAGVGDSRIYRVRGPAWPNTGRIEPLTFDNEPPGEFKESAKDAPVEWTLGAGGTPSSQWRWIEDRLEPGDAILCCSDGLFPSGFSPVILDLLVAWAALNARGAADLATLLVGAAHSARRGLTRDGRLQPTGLRDDTTVAVLTTGPLRPLGTRLPVWDPCWRARNNIDLGADAMGARLWRGALEDTLLREFLAGPWVYTSSDAASAFESEYVPRRRRAVSLSDVIQEPVVKDGEPRTVLRSRRARRQDPASPAAARAGVETAPRAADLPGTWWVRVPRGTRRIVNAENETPLLKIGRTLVRLTPTAAASDDAPSPARRCREVAACTAAVVPEGLLETGAIRGWILGGKDDAVRWRCVADLGLYLLSARGQPTDPAYDLATVLARITDAWGALLKDLGCVAVLRNGRETPVRIGAQGGLSSLWRAAEPLCTAAGLAEDALDHLLVLDGTVGLPACAVLDMRDNSLWEAQSAEAFLRLGASTRTVDLPIAAASRVYRIGQQGWPYGGLSLDDEFASPYHAEVARDDAGRIGVSDLDSDNGTWILSKPGAGDEIMLADAAVVRCAP